MPPAVFHNVAVTDMLVVVQQVLYTSCASCTCCADVPSVMQPSHSWLVCYFKLMSTTCSASSLHCNLGIQCPSFCQQSFLLGFTCNATCDSRCWLSEALCCCRIVCKVRAPDGTTANCLLGPSWAPGTCSRHPPWQGLVFRRRRSGS